MPEEQAARELDDVSVYVKHCCTLDAAMTGHGGVTVMLSAAATISFIAPAAYHRVRFQQHDKPHLIKVGNIFMLTGLAFLAAAMVAAVVLVTDLVFKDVTMIILGSIIAVAFAWFWFGYPLVRYMRGQRSH